MIDKKLMSQILIVFSYMIPMGMGLYKEEFVSLVLLVFLLISLIIATISRSGSDWGMSVILFVTGLSIAAIMYFTNVTGSLIGALVMMIFHLIYAFQHG